MEISEGVEMTSPGALGGWEQVRQEHDIILGIAGIGSLIVDRGRQGTMTALTKVLANDFVFVGGQERIKGLADQLQGVEIGASAVAKYLDLNLDREAPRGWRRRGRPIGVIESIASEAEMVSKGSKEKLDSLVVLEVLDEVDNSSLTGVNDPWTPSSGQAQLETCALLAVFWRSRSCLGSRPHRMTSSGEATQGSEVECQKQVGSSTKMLVKGQLLLRSD